MNSKGYIGPLGDDFPSIFPLLFGLLIFFSSLYVAYSTYQTKDNAVQVMKANIMISRAVRSQIYFDSDYWKYACKLALAMRGNYQVHLAMWLEYNPKPLNGGTPPFQSQSGLQLVKFITGTYSALSAVCPNNDESWKIPNTNTRSRVPQTPSEASKVISEIVRDREAATMTYPVIYVNSNGYDLPARLVVVTWR